MHKTASSFYVTFELRVDRCKDSHFWKQLQERCSVKKSCSQKFHIIFWETTALDSLTPILKNICERLLCHFQGFFSHLLGAVPAHSALFEK